VKEKKILNLMHCIRFILLKVEGDFSMKRMRIFIAGFCLTLLVACNSSDDNLRTTGTGSGTPEIRMTAPLDDEIRDVLENLDPIFRLTRKSEWSNERNNWINELLLIDVITGDIVATHEVEVGYSFFEPIDLGNGYYIIEMASRDDESLEYMIVILDAMLNIVDTVFYDIDLVSPLHVGFFKFTEGELIAYALEMWDEVPVGNLNPVAFNLHTGEIEILAEVDEFISNMHRFVGENQIFTTQLITLWDQGRITTSYGIIDIETGETHFFEKEDFGYGNIDFHSKRVLMSERHSMGPALINEVLIFEIETMTSTSVILEDEESHWARFSYDGNHIMTINEEASVLRKYDFNGVIIAEIEVEIPSVVTASEDYANDPNAYFWQTFEIIPLAENVYVIFTISTFGIPMGIEISEYFSQIIVLP